MKKKRLRRTIGFIVILTVAIFSMQFFCNQTLAEPTTGTSTNQNKNTSTASTPKSVQDIMNAGSNWLHGEQSNKPAGTEVNDFVDQFIGIGQVLVGIGIATILIVTMITAFKWITATPDKQAKLKQQLIGLVISAVVIFGAVGIWNLVRGIMENVETKISQVEPSSIVTIAHK